MADLEIDVRRDGGKVVVTARNGDAAPFADRCDPFSATSRERLVARFRAAFPGAAPETFDEFDGLIRDAIDKPRQVEKVADDGGPVPPNPEPWHEPVDGAELLDELVGLLGRFVLLPQFAVEAIALWTLHSYVFDLFEFSPRLLIRSPEKRCGKTRAVRMIDALVSRPLACENVSAAAMYRIIEKAQPTLLLDEGDTFLCGRDANEDLRGVVNSGFQRGGKAVRCVGDDCEPATFSTFSPVVIAMIGRPPETVEDRSIAISMRRKLAHEHVERPRPGAPLRQQFDDVVRRCCRWAADARERLAIAEPDVPKELDDRAADFWYVLLAIADDAGGRWPELARRVALGLMAERADESFGVQLLRDVHAVFVRQGGDRIASAVLLTELLAMDDHPWPDLGNGRGLTVRKLAKLLEPFGIRPGTIRTGDVTAKGYYRHQFEEPWRRYCPEVLS